MVEVSVIWGLLTIDSKLLKKYKNLSYHIWGLFEI